MKKRILLSDNGYTSIDGCKINKVTSWKTCALEKFSARVMSLLLPPSKLCLSNDHKAPFKNLANYLWIAEGEGYSVYIPPLGLRIPSQKSVLRNYSNSSSFLGRKHDPSLHILHIALLLQIISNDVHNHHPQTNSDSSTAHSPRHIDGKWPDLPGIAECPRQAYHESLFVLNSNPSEKRDGASGNPPRTGGEPRGSAIDGNRSISAIVDRPPRCSGRCLWNDLVKSRS